MRAQQSELLAVAERDIVTITPVVDGLSARCSKIEQELRGQIVAAERGAFRDELLANVADAASPGVGHSLELHRTETAVGLSR